VEEFRKLQDPTGAVVAGLARAEGLLPVVVETYRGLARRAGVRQVEIDAVGADAERWLARGLDTPPEFDTLLDAYGPPADGAPTLVLAPLLATNGPAPRGRFLECLFAVRDEVEEVRALGGRYPHPRNGCQSMRLLAGTEGLLSGNCIVFFPENIASSRTDVETTFAQFFFNKFRKIYREQTIPVVHAVTGVDRWASADLDEEATYHARCVWGYLHDYHHYQGTRPWDEAMDLKLKFFPGLLEEIKVDAQTGVLCGRDADIPYGRDVVEMMLLERLFRYPAQPDAPTNFDAGTGLLMFEWLARAGAGITVTAEGIVIDVDGCLDGLDALVTQILDLEALPDAEYVAAAERFVRRFIAPGEKRRLAVPERYQRAVRDRVDAPALLSFAELVPSGT
jgi:hypothetical protein